jgi:hypothetical protein
MDLSGHHSNPRAPLEALLDGASGDAETRRGAAENGRPSALGATAEAVRAAHPRQGRIIDAIRQVLGDEGAPLQAREVHAQVETLLGEPVRWATVKATLAGNLGGRTPRFVRVTRGRYGIPSPPSSTPTGSTSADNPDPGHPDGRPSRRGERYRNA